MEFPTTCEDLRRIFSLMSKGLALGRYEVSDVAAGEMVKESWEREVLPTLSVVGVAASGLDAVVDAATVEVAVGEDEESANVSVVGLGIALLTRLASNSTKTAEGLISRTSCPAKSALSDEMCAVPNR